MDDILAVDNMKEQDVLYPSCRNSYIHDFDAPILILQLTHFECGGMAISLTWNHKLGDAHTIFRFMNDWAAMVREPSIKGKKPPLTCPKFFGASVFPPKDDPSFSGYGDVPERPTVTKLFVFDREKLSKLKTDSGVDKASSFEAVTALLYKCAMSAAAKAASSGTFEPSSLCIPVNLRSLLGIKDIENCTGNVLSTFPVFTNEEADADFSRLVSEIKRRKTQLCERYKGASYVNDDLASGLSMEAEELLNLARRKNWVAYVCSSWCNLQMYDADFGWGKPVCVNLAHCPFRNVFILMDKENMGGIRAWVALEEQVMSVFQNDPHLLPYLVN